MATAAPMDLDGADLRVPFSQKWEMHKRLLGSLYLDESYTLPKIKKVMKEEHDFDAEVHQYKYQFKKWGWKKSISSAKKTALLQIGQRRLQQGRETTITYKGKELDPRKLLRHARRAGGQQLALFPQAQESSRMPYSIANPILGNRPAFYMWSLPHNILLQYLPRQMDASSPFSIVSTPSDVDVTTPKETATSSTAISQAVSLKASKQRADLFISGKFDELLKSLDRTERKAFSTWLYQFWYFGFKTAKNWGRGPQNWTTYDLWPQETLIPSLYSASPPQVSNLPSPMAQSPNASKRPIRHIPEPTMLCRWSIHIYPNDGIEWVDDVSQDQGQDLRGDEWPEDWLNASFEQKLQEGVQDNRFSTLNSTELPVHTGQIAAALLRSPDEAFKQSLGFAIIGRNVLLVEQLLEKVITRAKREELIGDIYPFHLATTYLDGSRSCCQILQLLTKFETANLRPNSIGPTGYTPLDNLMIGILRNHSNVSPEVVDENLRGHKRFGGEEVDVCGRWDADSDHYQALLKTGSGTIPFGWKHKFCHTSIQAVCHAIFALSLDLYKCPPSGMFVKHCFVCGLKLQLPPLHALVLTAFYLAEFGAEGEDLFGMMCCLLAFVVSSSSEDIALERGHVSIELLLGEHASSFCTHSEISAAEFATRLSPAAQDRLSVNAKRGWVALCQTLQLVEEQYTWTETGFPPAGYEDEAEEPDEEDDGDEGVKYRLIADSYNPKLLKKVWWDGHLGFPDRCYHLEFERPRAFGMNRLLGHIWAACQCELLTYRRLGEGESWSSNRLDIGILLSALESGNEREIPFVAEAMMEPYCACGLFDGINDICRREEACTDYYSNLDIWDRTAFLEDRFLGDY